jgi:hypothetical protein
MFNAKNQAKIKALKVWKQCSAIWTRLYAIKYDGHLDLAGSGKEVIILCDSSNRNCVGSNFLKRPQYSKAQHSKELKVKKMRTISIIGITDHSKHHSARSL